MSNVVDQIILNQGCIMRWALFFCPVKEDAEDLASDTICKALSNAHRFNPRHPIRPWLKTILINTFIKSYHRKRRVSFCPLEEGYAFASTMPPTDCPASVERIKSVIRQCARSSVTIRSVILFAAGYSYEEIADRQRISIGTVKSSIAFGRKMIRNALGMA